MVVFAITGTLSRPRAQIVADINRAGHTVATSLTKAVQYLVQGASNRANDSIKATKAANAGIKVINESQLMRMLNGGGSSGGGGGAAASSSKKRVTPARAPRAKKAATASPATGTQQQRRTSQMASHSYASPSSRRSADFAEQMAASRSATTQQKRYRPADSPSSTRRYFVKSSEWYKRPPGESYIRRYIISSSVQEGSEHIREAVRTLSSLMGDQFDAIKPIYSHLSQAMQQLGSALREVGDQAPIGRDAVKSLKPLSMIQRIRVMVHSAKSLYSKEAQALKDGGRMARSVLNETMQLSAAVKKLTNASYHLARAQDEISGNVPKATPSTHRDSKRTIIAPPVPVQVEPGSHRDSRRTMAHSEVVAM